LSNLHLNNNKLYGNIPLELMNLNLSKLNLDNNHLTATDPELIAWLDSHNPDWNTTQIPYSLLFSFSIYSITEDAGQMIITVKRLGATDGAVSVDYITNDNTAIAGSDYIATSGTLNWEDGDVTDKTFTVQLIDDEEPENNEILILSLNNVTGDVVLGTPNTAVLMITDNTNCAKVTEIPVEECQALIEFYNRTGGEQWNNNTGWHKTNTPCSWYGITCSGGHITGLDLHNNQLSGYIPRELENLTHLQSLLLNNNELCGEIPLINLNHLSVLNLDSNHLITTVSELIIWLDGINPGWNTTQTFSQLNDDLIIDFGDTEGIWLMMNNQNWVQLHNMSAESMVTGDIDGNGQDDIIFDSGIYGVWAWMNNSHWVLLLPVSPESMVVGDLDGNGQDDVIFNSNTYGIWAWMNNSRWNLLHSFLLKSIMVTGDIDGNGQDEVIIDFGEGYGIWLLQNNSDLVQLHSVSPESMVTGDIDGNGQDDVIIDFGSEHGIWLLQNNSDWVQLHSVSPESMVTGDIDGNGQDDVIIDFGSEHGIWLLQNNSDWVQLHSVSPESMVTGDIDGNGQDDVIIDFGSEHGIWLLQNNSDWVQLDLRSPESMVMGNIVRCR